MKRRMLVLLSALFIACGLALGGCGGNSGNPAAQKFVGTWKLASVEQEGVTVVGDFSQIFTDGEGDIRIDIKEDASGTVTYQGESGPFSWELSDDDTLVMKSDGLSALTGDADDESVELTYADGALSMVIDVTDGTLAAAFTQSGTIEGAPELDVSGATPITSLDQLEGTWTMASMRVSGATAYGSPEDLGAYFGDETAVQLSVGSDGVVQFLGDEFDVIVGDEGASIDLVMFQIPVMSLNDGVVIDLSDALGEEAYVYYAK